MRKRIQRCLILLASAGLLFLGMGTETAKASGERVYFGSEAYEWELNMEDPYLLGTYAAADGEIESAQYYVVYDPQMLEFADGGELVEPGRVLVRSSEIEGNEFRRMMNFHPLMGGQTEIRIEESGIDSGNGSVAAGTASVPVDIPIPGSCALEGITVNGIPMESFDANVTDYSLEMQEYAEQVDIALQPENMTAEISDTRLVEGENRITIVTTDAEGNHARYTLHITCPEQVVPADTVPETESVQQPEEEPEETESDEMTFREFVVGCGLYLRDMAVHHKAWAAAAGICVFLLIVLLVARRYLERRRRRRAKEQGHSRKQKTLSYTEVQQKERQNPEGARVPKPIQISVDSLWDEPELKMPDPVTHPGEEDTEETAKAETVREMTSFTEADLKEASDYLEADEVEIEVSHVTIDFKREKDESGSIKELVIKTLTGQRDVVKFRALDDISFTVMKGEVVGIIGTNGSGKSTILKISSGVLAPTAGSVKVDRRKVQLLTLGTGFDTELTGRENVYLNGAIIGYTKEYIDEKYDEIVKFAELEGFMDERVKNYSSGMVSRLGFAIATARETPGILILDEVLSVGDMFFRKKSEARIQEMIHGGSTVLIVSHSPSVIRKNCTKVVWIEKGKLKAVGDPKEVCDAYEKMNQ